MACVNINSKEFKDAVQRLNINSGELELIAHKFINQSEENLDKFPSDLYILELLSPNTFEASSEQLDLYFKARHDVPMQFNNPDTYKLELDKLKSYYPEEAVKGYQDANGLYNIQIATPKVAGIPMVLDNSMIDSFTRGLLKNNPYHMLFNKLVLSIGKDNINIRMLKESPIGKSGNPSYADYNPTTNTITFYTDSILNKKQASKDSDAYTRRYIFKTLTHELLHQLTYSTVNGYALSEAALAFSDKINTLYNEALQYFNGDKSAHYGLFDVNEFISEAMTNINFQRDLAKIKSKEGNKQKSLWSKLIDAIGDFFKLHLGIDISNTMLEDIISSVEDFIDYAKPIEDLTIKDLEEQTELYDEAFEQIQGVVPQSYSELHEALKAFRGDWNRPSYKGFTTGRFENTRGKWRIIIPESFKGTVAEARDIAKEMLGSKGATEEMYSLGKDFDSITENGVTYTTLRVGFKSDKRDQKNTTKVKDKIKVPKSKMTPEERARQDAIDLLLEVRPDLKDRIENGLIDVDYLINNPDEITTLASAFESPNEIKEEYTVEELLNLDNTQNQETVDINWGYREEQSAEEQSEIQEKHESAYKLTFLAYSNIEAAEALDRVLHFFLITAIEAEYPPIKQYHDFIDFIQDKLQTSEDKFDLGKEAHIHQDLKLLLLHKDALLKAYLDNFIRFNREATKLEEILRATLNSPIENVTFEGIDISDWLNNRRSIIQQHDKEKKGSQLTIFDDYKIAPVKIKGLSTLENQLDILNEPATIVKDLIGGNTQQYDVTIPFSSSEFVSKQAKWRTENPTGIVAYRVNKNTFNTPEAVEQGIIGNPFDWQKYGNEKAGNMFYDWLVTGNNFGEEKANEAFRQAIINKILSSEQGTPILYYKELNRPSHATTIGYLINNKLLLTNTNVDKKASTYQPEEVLAYLTNFTLHSGGAEGSDITWGKIGEEFGLENTNHYYTGQRSGMNAPHGNKEISTLDYEEGRSEAAKAAQRNWGYSYPYMKDTRLIRNWAQVKYADAIFAIGTIVHPGERIFPNQKNDTRTAVTPSVTGGTGYAVGMAILHDKPVYVFDLNTEQWYTWDSEVGDFIETDTPVLTENFAGIGTREINDAGRKAIRDVYAKTTQALYDEAMSAPFRELLELDNILKLMDENFTITRGENGGIQRIEVNKDNVLANQVIEHLKSIGIEVHSRDEMELYLKDNNYTSLQEYINEVNSLYTPEMQDILNNAPRNEEGQLLVYPGGPVSNLDARQYAHVRTKAFKEWFGDWEKIAELKNLDSDFSIIENNEETPDEVAKGYDIIYNGKKIGRVALIEAPNGNLTIRGIGIDENIRGKGIGKNLYKWLIYKAYKNGGTLYSDNVYDSTISPSAHRVWKSLIKENFAVEDNYSGGYHSALNASKVVDENGEPLVVYHGGSMVNIFDTTGKYKSAGIKKGDKGAYFTTSKSSAQNYESIHDYKYGDAVFEILEQLKESGLTDEEIQKEWNSESMRGLRSGTRAFFLNIRNPKRTEYTGERKKGYTQHDNNIGNNDGQIIKVEDSKEVEYVAFKPNQIKSATDNVGTYSKESNNIQEFTTENGEVYGFITPEGLMYLDENVIDEEHPIHEYTHLWDRAVKNSNLELWMKGVELMQATSLWNEIANSEQYGKKWANQRLSREERSDLIASEVHARLVGRNGALLLRDLAEELGKTGIIDKLKKWLTDFWKELKSTFGTWNKADIDKLTLEEFNAMTLRDFAEGTPLKNTTSLLSQREQLRESTAQREVKNTNQDPFLLRTLLITEQVNNLRNSSSLTNSEITEIAEDIVYWISDFITDLQKNTESVLDSLQEAGVNVEHLRGEDFANMARADVVKKLGVRILLDRAKQQFDPERNTENEYYKDYDVKELMWDVMDNFEGLMEIAQPIFLTTEKFSIKYNDLGLAEISDDLSESIDATDFNNTNEEEAIKEIEANEAEHWMIESRTRDIMEDMLKAVENALLQCFILDENGNRVKSKRGIDKRVDRRQATNSIVRWTLGALTLSDMITKLQEKLGQHPWLSQLISKLLDLSGEYNDLQSQFFSDFYKPFQLYSVVKYEKGMYKSMPVNEHKALTEATNQIKAQYNTGKHPLFTSEGVNKKTFEDLQEAYNAIKEITSNKDIDWNNEGTKEKLAHNLAFAANCLGYYTIPEMVMDSITENNVKVMQDALRWIEKSLSENLDNKSYEPFTFKAKGSIDNNIKLFLRPLTDSLEDVAVSSFFDSGKMYQSYITPSYMAKLMQKFRLTGDSFQLFIENEFKKYDWFYDKNTGEWLNDWILQLATDEKAKEVFAHKTLLNFNKKNYMKDMDDMEYTMSLISEYFAESENETLSKVPAWFRIPMISNKPSSEFIRFYSYRGITYKDNIADGLKNIFDLELRRIQTVTMRNRAKTDPDFIKNWDTNGKKFNFLTFMNDYLKDNPAKEKEFSSLLKKKIKGETLQPGEEETLYAEAKRIIMEEMEAKAKSTVDNWEAQGILEAAKKITGLGKNPAEIREKLENFVWNDYYAAMNIMELTITDIAFYKNAEDLQKRLAQIHSPGIRGNAEAKLYKSFKDKYGGDKVTDGFTRTFYLRDFEDFKSNIIENVGIVFDKKIAEARQKGNETEAKGLEALKESLVGEDGAYRKINVTDAQGYCSPTAYMKKATIFGKWSEERQRIYDRLKKGEASYAEIKEAFQPLKPFVYSQIEKLVDTMGAPMLNIKMGVQNKNSEYLLILADAITKGYDTGRPNLLRAIYQIMEESHFDREGRYKADGIDTVQFESTVKTGLTGVVDINKYISLKPFTKASNGELQAKRVMEACIYKSIEEARPTRLEVNKDTNEFELIESAPITRREYNNTFIHAIPIEDYSIQLETPEHFKKHSLAHGSQGRYIIPSELAETDIFGNEVLYNVKNVVTNADGTTEVRNEKVNAKTFKERYERNIAENILESLDEVRRELNLDPSLSIKDRNIAISKVLQREILSSPRYGVDLLLACSVDENGRFRIPLGDPIQSKRIEQLLTSIIKNRVNKLKIAGGPVVQVSNFGTSRELNIRFKDKNGGLLMTREEWEKSREKIPDRVYHYSNESDLTEFLIKEDNYFSLSKGGTKNAIFFTDNTAPREGTVLARNNKYTVKLDAKKVKVVRGTKELMHQRGTSYTEEVNKAEQEGYDAIRFLDLDDNQENNQNITVVFDPKKATILGREDTVPSKESNESTYEQYIKNNLGGIAYFEVFAPIYSDELLKFADGLGNIDIDMIELVNPDLLKMVGYRIPTEAKYSMAPLKIVGFLPREAGEGIMLPNDITLLTGSDFDIDKEYLMRKEFDIAWKYEPKSLKSMSEEELAKLPEAELDWLEHNKRNIKTEIRKELEKTSPLTKREYNQLERQVNGELQMAISAEDRTHKENIDNINRRFLQLTDTEDYVENSKDPETDEAIHSSRIKNISKERKDAISKENKRHKNNVRRIQSQFAKEKDAKLNKLIKQFEKNKVRKAVDDFFKVDINLPTKLDNPLTRAIRKSYLDKVVKVIEPTSGRSFRNNQIVDMTYEVLTHEQSAAEMLNPGGFEPLKRMGYLVAAYRDPNNTKTWLLLEAMTTDELKDLCQVDKNLMDIDTHIQFYKQNSAAGSLIGIFAVERVAHAVIENEGYRMDVFKACGIDNAFKVMGLVFGGYEKTDPESGISYMVNTKLMEIDVRQNSNGESIGKVLGSLVASAADAVKDPVLNLMNINSQTANILNTLVRLGIPFEDAALFLSSAAVSNVLRTLSRKNLSGFTTFSDVINSRIKEIETTLGITKDSVIHKEELTKEELIKSVREKDMTLSIEYKVLQALKKFKAMGDAMRLPTFATRFNSISNATGPLAVDNLMVEYKMRKLSADSCILSKDDSSSYISIWNIIQNHPILDKFVNSFALAKELLGNQGGITANSNSFRNFLFTLEADEINGDLYDKIMRDRKLLSNLSDFYQSYMLVLSGVIDANELQYYITEFPNEFLKKDYKNKYKDNLLIQSIRFGNDKSDRLTLEVNLTGVDTRDKEKIGDAWSDLYKLDKDLALQLFKYCFFRGGIGFNPKSFMALLPLQMKEAIPNYIDTFRLLPDVVPSYVFDLFIRNNWDSGKLVPSLDSSSDNMLITSVGNGVFRVKMKLNSEQFKLARTPYFKVRVEENGLEVDKLYVIDNIVEGEGKEPPTLFFREIEPLGSNKDYIELSTQHIDKATDTTIKVEEDEVPPGIQDTEVSEEAPRVYEDAPSPEIPGYTDSIIHLNENEEYYRDLAYKAFLASPSEKVRNSAREIVDTWKNKSDKEKKSSAKSTKSFFKLMFDKLGIQYDEDLVDKVYESIC